MSQSNSVMTYVPDEQYERWLKEYDSSGMSKSEWVRAMVEAGLKKFNRDARPDETKDDLRQKNTDLRTELQRARDRIETLEERLNVSEREAILEHVEENPGTEYGDILQHLTNTAHTRVTQILDQLEGSEIEIDEQGRMYTKR